MGCRQCLPFSVVQLKGKHCQKPHCRNGVVDTFGQCQTIDICKHGHVRQAIGKANPLNKQQTQIRTLEPFVVHTCLCWCNSLYDTPFEHCACRHPIHVLGEGFRSDLFLVLCRNAFQSCPPAVGYYY